MLLLLGACSGTTFVYNRLDFILPWYVDDYTDLNGHQEIYFEELLTPFLTWHRNQELPDYVRILANFESSLDKPQTPATIAAVFSSMEAAWLRLEREGLDRLLDLGAQLSDEQIAQFLETLWEQQEEYEEEYLDRSDAQFHEESEENLIDNAQEYLGSLSTGQRELVRQSSERLLRSDRAWLQERVAWLEQLAELLKREPGWQQRVIDAVAARRGELDPEYLQIYQHNMDVIFDLIAQLLNSRTERQNQYLRDKLAELRTDLETLVAQGKQASDCGPAGC
jgi:hypothetical protein